MDRTLKVYAKTGHLFAEIEFWYEKHNDARGRYTSFRRLYSDEEEDESKSVYPMDERDFYLQYRKFNTIDDIKQHDIDVIRKELGRDMTDPRGYDYVYDADMVLTRYVAESQRGCVGMVNIYYSFLDNVKEVKFLSATNPRYDMDISSDSLESHMQCMERIEVYRDREEPIALVWYDLKKLPVWY
ncbi:hypothetical protein [Flavobacterium pallidum]|uniref:Uncharacterized protein n=1 Tax=Flavobacterium pallidum TaxID=2172098 RepID=A0A2S1SIT4_9FLAO|nr:hypothetical protein [Flavobacterium pallidum]AWI26310.1 hypothetical protein HYN49_10590 [Flavobacterium pallidum]